MSLPVPRDPTLSYRTVPSACLPACLSQMIQIEMSQHLNSATPIPIPLALILHAHDLCNTLRYRNPRHQTSCTPQQWHGVVLYLLQQTKRRVNSLATLSLLDIHPPAIKSSSPLRSPNSQGLPFNPALRASSELYRTTPTNSGVCKKIQSQPPRIESCKGPARSEEGL